jgi:hypothetical protein
MIDWAIKMGLGRKNLGLKRRPGKKKKKKSTPGGTRTHNRLIRSQTPYPLGHRRFAADLFRIFLIIRILQHTKEKM